MLSLSADRMNSARAARVSGSLRNVLLIRGIMVWCSEDYADGARSRSRGARLSGRRHPEPRGDSRQAAAGGVLVERTPLRQLAHVSTTFAVQPELVQLALELFRCVVDLDLAAELVHRLDGFGPFGEVTCAQHGGFDIP